jgi:ZIP family zinc transporter
MIAAAGWGLVAAATLVVGAVIALWVPIPRRFVALLMGFGAGALTSAVAFDLTEEAFKLGGTTLTAIGLAAGALTFFLGDVTIDRWRSRASAGGPDTPSNGLAIVLGALLDGVPESVVLGASLIGGAGVSPSFLAAVVLSNVPEGVGGTRDLRDEGHPPQRILAIWVAVALASAVAAGIGFALLDEMSSQPLAIAEAFAAGAILTMLADSMFPEAFTQGGQVSGLATVLGFATAYFLSAA